MIYICYGITKSASTFLYQLTEEVFAVAGRKPRKLGPPYRRQGSLDNYFDVVDDALVRELADLVGDDDIVLKTHGPPRGNIAALIASGAVLANASIRDPREIALSMLDHGRRAKRWKDVPFAEFQSLEDTLPAIENQIGYFNAWAEIPGVHVFLYNDICFDSRSVVRRLASQIGVEIDPDQVLKTFIGNKAIGQFSKGKALRHSELHQDDHMVFLERFADLYRSYAFDTPRAVEIAEQQQGKVLRARGQLAINLINLRRRFRFLNW
ncbi:hypothetical protein ASG72_04150 [Bosea sp. Leaf344]|uniref:hypothetical protein n=1 Tax=Bosea sp. Leaf344 TaxID=1736346 RepID=UPI000701A6F4|nr:hypothetical protein [Bosea sp. Leaf344]KQU54811.1 hypothetical protein ASG72_04150 [Bosea sp. Leaf344]